MIHAASAEKPGDVRIGWTKTEETREAVREVLRDVDAAGAALLLVFYSPHHDPDVVAKELAASGATCAIGGSTAGEIAPEGFIHGAITAISLRGDHVRATSALLPRLDTLLPVASVATHLTRQLGLGIDQLDPSRHVWMTLFDGLGGYEDVVTPYFAQHAPRLPIIGGSVGDASDFRSTSIAYEGEARFGAGVVILLEYDRPFELLHHTHMEFSEHWHEVTSHADGGRMLTHLDGRPAVEVYADSIGADVEALGLDITGHRPFGFRFRGRPFPCSILQATRRGFRLAYSVQVGDRVNILQPVDMIGKSRELMASASRRLADRGTSPQAALLFHCFGRYLEASADGILDELFEAMDQMPLVGLNTYGEQWENRHMNHSITGIVLG